MAESGAGWWKGGGEWWDLGVSRAETKSGIKVARQFQKTGVGWWRVWWQNLALSGGGGGGKIWHCGGGRDGGKNWQGGGKNWGLI